jgi:oligoendopeptidase F
MCSRWPTREVTRCTPGTVRATIPSLPMIIRSSRRRSLPRSMSSCWAAYMLKHADSKEMTAYILGKQIDDVVRPFSGRRCSPSTRCVSCDGGIGRADHRGFGSLDLPQASGSYFGPEVHLFAVSDLEGLRIPHFYRAFYVYSMRQGSARRSPRPRRHGGNGKSSVNVPLVPSSREAPLPHGIASSRGRRHGNLRTVDTALETFKELLDRFELLMM